MQDAELGDLFRDRLAGQVAQVIGGEIATVDTPRNGSDLLVGLAHLAQLVVVQEIHSNFGVLRHAVARALVAHRLPQRHDDVAVKLGVLGDVVFEVPGIAAFGEGAGPFMRQHEDVGALVNREGLQQVQGVVVIALGVGLVELDLDALVGAGGGQHLVQRLARGNQIAGAQGARAIRARPDLDHHVFGRGRAHRGAQQCTGSNGCERKIPVLHDVS